MCSEHHPALTRFTCSEKGALLGQEFRLEGNRVMAWVASSSEALAGVSRRTDQLAAAAVRLLQAPSPAPSDSPQQ